MATPPWAPVSSEGKDLVRAYQRSDFVRGRKPLIQHAGSGPYSPTSALGLFLRT
jgi:hypothetical protein